jgi:hypothetical protein
MTREGVCPAGLAAIISGRPDRARGATQDQNADVEVCMEASGAARPARLHQGNVEMEDAINARFAAIERENRRLKWLLGCVALGTMVVATERTSLIRQGAPIEADRFAIRDKSGTVRVSLGLAYDGAPELLMFDAKGRESVGLRSTNDDAAQLSFLEKGKQRIGLWTSGEGTAALELKGPNGGSKASMFLWPDRTAGLSLADDLNGVMIGVQPDQLSGLCVTDAEGVERGRVGNLPPDAQCLGLTRRDGKAPFRITAAPAPKPSAKVEPPVPAETTAGADTLGEIVRDQAAYTDWPEPLP